MRVSIHSRANVVRAVQLGVPAILIIRNPKDAILGFCSYVRQRDLDRWSYPGDELARKDILLKAWRYRRFYEPLLALHDRLLVVDFKEVITDIGDVTDRLNRRFGTSFRCFEHTDENVQELFSTAPKHLYPSDERKQRKAQYEAVWNTLAQSEPIRACEQLYARYQQVMAEGRVRMSGQ